jgi:hypothetical protein
MTNRAEEMKLEEKRSCASTDKPRTNVAFDFWRHFCYDYYVTGPGNFPRNTASGLQGLVSTTPNQKRYGSGLGIKLFLLFVIVGVRSLVDEVTEIRCMANVLVNSRW